MRRVLRTALFTVLVSLAVVAVAYAGVRSSTFLEFDEVADPGAPSAGKSRLWADSTSHGFKLRLNGGSAVDLASSADFTGDSGSGGVHGLVPAPAAGDAAAGKYLKADGNWTVPGGGGSSPFTDTAGVIYPTTASDRLVVGNSTGTALYNLSLVSDGGNPAGLTVKTDATATPAYDAFVAGDTNRRFYVFGNGDVWWGPGNAGQDVKLIRSAAINGAVGLDLNSNVNLSGATPTIASSGAYPLLILPPASQYCTIKTNTTIGGSTKLTLNCYDPTSGNAIYNGGGVLFSGNVTGTTPGNFAVVSGVKENGSSSDSHGVLVFSTNDGGGTPVEVWRATSAGALNAGGLTATGSLGYVLQRSDGVFQWANGTSSGSTADTGISRLAAASHAFGNGTANDVTGTLNFSTAVMGGKITKYGNVTTAGLGVPAVYGSGRTTAQTAANTSIATYTVGASDGSFIVSGNVNVTASATFSINEQVTYTDETNTVQTVTLNFQSTGGTLLTAITNVQGVGPYEGIPVHLRAKASTAITVKTAGTFTSVTYNAEGVIQQIQ